MLSVSDYVTEQIKDHGITGEAETKRYLERNEPVAVLRLVSYSHSLGQKFTPCLHLTPILLWILKVKVNQKEQNIIFLSLTRTVSLSNRWCQRKKTPCCETNITMGESRREPFPGEHKVTVPSKPRLSQVKRKQNVNKIIMFHLLAKRLHYFRSRCHSLTPLSIKETRSSATKRELERSP